MLRFKMYLETTLTYRYYNAMFLCGPSQCGFGNMALKFFDMPSITRCGICSLPLKI